MSLIHYQLDYSGLSSDETEALIKRIDAYSYTGFDVNPHKKIGHFFIEETEDISIYQIPASCPLTRL